MLAEAAIVALAIAIAARAAGRRARRERGLRIAPCRWVAARRGGVIDEEAATLTLQAGDARIVLSVAEEITELEVVYPVAAGPWFELRPRVPGELGLIVLSVAAKDMNTGSAPLDEQYVLASLDAQGCRPMWSPRVASLLLRVFQCTTITGRSESLTISIPRTCPRAADVDAALDLASELGNTDLFGAAALRALPQAERCGTGRQACVKVAVGGAIVHFRPALERGALATVASIDTGDEDGASFAVRLPADDPSGLAASVPRTLPPDAVQRLARVGPGRLAAEGRHVQFVWDGIERDAGRLMTAGRVVASLTARREAPYR